MGYPRISFDICYCFWIQIFASKRSIALVFLIGDIIRWLSVFISLWLPDPFPEPYF